MAAEHERPTVENVRRHMDDDPCVICGAAGHTVWDNCGKLASPLAHDSPVSKIFGKNNAMNVRAAIRKYVKEPRPAEATKPATVVGSSTKDQDLGINGQSSEPAGDQVRKPADAQTEADTEQRKLHEAIAQAPTGLDGLKKVRDISQGEAVQTVASDPTNVSESVKLGEGNTFNPIPSLSKAGEAKFALRKELSISSSQVFTNHFEISFKPKTEFFVYEVLKMPTGKSKRKSRFILKTAIEAWDFLRDNKQHFTTDNVNTIIAWKNLHRLLDTQHCVVEGKKNTQFGAVWMPNAIADGTERLQLFLKLHRKLDLDGLAAYIDASRKSSVPDFDFNPIVWALNLAITSSLSADNVFQQSTNKFFVKNGHKPLTGGQNLSTLCTIRGYYYTIKPAMQKVLLKVNPVTSAFYRPITVSEYLTDTSFEWEERIKLLRTLTLYIEPDRKAAEDQVEQDRVDNLNKPQNRIKKFFDFGPLFTDKSMSFAKGSLNDQGQWVQATTRTRVIDHMKAVFGKEFNDKKAAINVGTAADPIYYPAEYLRIMPYQIYKRMLPDSLVESMLEQASHIPTQSRRLVEIEAMQCLGLDPKQGAQEFVSSPCITTKYFC
jgi:eukaryotic translation initiation factor 2C